MDALEMVARQSGQRLGVHGIAQGVCVVDRNNCANGLQERFREILSIGPDKITNEVLDGIRCTITNSLIELSTLDEKDFHAIFATGLSLYESLGFLLLADRRLWRAKGKWTIKQLQEKEPELANEYLEVFKALANGDRNPLCEFAIKTLENYGGTLWESTLSHPAPQINQ